MAQVTFDVDPWEILQDLSDEELVEELESRGYFSCSSMKEIVDLIELHGWEDHKVQTAVKELLQNMTGRTITKI